MVSIISDGFWRKFYMSIHRASIKFSIALALTSVALFTISASGQSQATRPNSADKGIAAAQGRQSGNPENKVAASEPKPGSAEKKVAAEEPRPNDLQSEIAAVKAENTAVRELLRKMEEQQKALSLQIDRLHRRLEGSATTDVPRTLPQLSPIQTETTQVSPPDPAVASEPSLPARVAKAVLMDDDKYKEGIVLIETSPEARIPFQLKFTNVSQFRYLNTLGTNDAFTDHLGNVREVAKRNDLTVNREMFTFAGYIFDKRLTYGLFAWTSATTTQVVVSGNVSWRFNKAITLNTGYWAVPGTRTLTFTFPYFTQPERSMADNFFRPGFTQGIWFTGEPVKGLNYDFFIGNGLNTLTIPSSKIDTNLTLSGSVWWEPLGPYGPDGKSRNMYDDYFASRKPVIRVGTSFTNSREDRFSNLDQSNPENTSIHNSDGVLAFSTGAFAPGVTVEEATYRMWAIDGGIKYRGLAINGQYYFRRLNDFKADGLLPISSTFDHGGELSASHFFIPKKLMLYGRGSSVRGQFGNSYEYAGGFKWYFVPTQRVWLQGEALRIFKSPYGSTITQYSGGMTGWAPTLQLVFSF
jgi:hypothetical protein